MSVNAEPEIVNSEPLLQAFADGWAPYDDGEIYEWASRNVILPPAYNPPGPFNVSKSRYMVDVFKALKNPYTRVVYCMAPPRSGKTLVGELFVIHSIANKSGTVLWIQSGDKMSDKVSGLRMSPLLYNCKPVASLIPNRNNAITKNKFSFDHMTVYLTGANINALQSLGYCIIIGDECWLWKEGLMGEAHSRTLDFASTSKEFYISQGAKDPSDEWAREFESAPVHEWGWTCPNCKKQEVLDWKGRPRSDGSWGNCISWDKKYRNKEGLWDYVGVAKSVWLECWHCRHRIYDNPQNRRYLNDTGSGLYICTKKDGDPKKISFRWNDLAVIDRPWGDLVVEYLQAKHVLKTENNKTAYQQFHQKHLAKTWNADEQKTLAQIVLATYDVAEKWGDYTYMTIDPQDNFSHFYYVIRSWAKNGDSRLIKYGRTLSWQELRDIQKTNGIPNNRVLIDSGNFATQVYSKCVEFASPMKLKNGKLMNIGWIALKGWDAVDFLNNGKRTLFSPLDKGDPNLGKAAQGKTCPVYKWSNPSIKRILVFLRDGKGAQWLASQVDDDYTQQLNSEEERIERDKKTNKPVRRFIQKTGVPNHYWDCECMQVVAAALNGIMGNATVGQQPKRIDGDTGGSTEQDFNI